MGQCRNCRWWVPFKPDESYGTDYNQRLAGKGFCEATRTDEGEPVHHETLAWAEDAEGYKASLVTSPDFGCVQFEKRAEG